MYDAFETPRAVRGDLAAPQPRRGARLPRRRARARARGPRPQRPRARSTRWCSSTSTSTPRRCCRRSSSPGSPPRPGSPPPRRARGARRHTGLEAIEIPGGPFAIGAPDDRFAYDNERPRHIVDLPAFRIGRTPITNATFLRFVEGGGYQRREWWSDEGWSWKEDYDITHPGGWAAGPDGWRQWRIDGWAPLHPDEPVVHVSWFEADAFARAHGARLPTEAEWEKAAAWDQQRGRSLPYPWGEQSPSPATAGPTSTRPASARTRPARSRRRRAERPARDARRHVGVDRDRVRRLPRLHRPPLPRVLRGLLRRGLPGPARRLVGDALAWRPRRSATGTSRSGARSSPACGWHGTPRPARRGGAGRRARSSRARRRPPCRTSGPSGSWSGRRTPSGRPRARRP